MKPLLNLNWCPNAIALGVWMSALALEPVTRAGLPEPDTVIYGSIAIDGVSITAVNSDVTVEVRKSMEEPAVAVYTMGESAAVGNRYLLRAAMESAEPLSNPDATAIGGTVFLVVKKAGVEKATQSVVLSQRGAFLNLNFGSADTDGDGMSDEFELQYFGSATGGNPNADSDSDGRPNRREFLQGTNPMVADGRHPADLTPSDDRLNIQEITEYALAWKLGDPWSIEPVTIPVDYVTRASALWVGGERYVFDNDPVTTAPLWWVQDPNAVPPASDGPEPVAENVAESSVEKHDLTETEALRRELLADAQGGTSAPRGRPATQGLGAAEVTRRLPLNYAVHQPFTVTIHVAPGTGTRAFAVEETPPDGWLVRFVNSAGRFDARNKRVKWGPFYGAEPRILTYEVTPLSQVASARFSGSGSFDGNSQAIDGLAMTYPPGQSPETRLNLSWDSGQLNLEVVGVPGRTHLLQVSDAFEGWTDLGSVTTDESGRGRIAVEPGASARFFRLSP
jgi:hypothetical protein